MQSRSKKNPLDSPSVWAAYLGEYRRALHEGDGASADGIISELATELGLVEICSELMTPAMRSIGDSWCSGEIGVGQEHLASQIVLNQLERLRAIYAPQTQRSSYRVLVSCVEGEQHFLAARMFADLCAEKGWMVDFLGADVPVSEILNMAQRRRPQIVALSATMKQGIIPARRMLEELRNLSHPPKVILGGQAIAEEKTWPTKAGESAVVADLREGITIAAQFQHADRPQTVLREYLLDLGRRVRELRTRKGWTQEQLAEAARVTRVCIVAVEGGKQNVSMDIVVRMANALGIKPEGLLTGEDAS